LSEVFLGFFVASILMFYGAHRRGKLGQVSRMELIVHQHLFSPANEI